MAIERLTLGLFLNEPEPPTILICGSSQALSGLANAIRALGVGELPVLEFSPTRADVKGALRFRAVFQPKAQKKGCVAVPWVRGATSFEWVLDDEMCLEIAEKIEHLAESAGAGHQYLSVEDTDDADIVLSKDEHELAVFAHAR